MPRSFCAAADHSPALVRAGAIPLLMQVCRPRRAAPDPAAKMLAGAVLTVLTQGDQVTAEVVTRMLGGVGLDAGSR